MRKINSNFERFSTSRDEVWGTLPQFTEYGIHPSVI